MLFLIKACFKIRKFHILKTITVSLKKNYIPLILNAKFLVGLVSSVVIEALIFNKSYLAIAFKNKIDKFYSAKWWFKAFIHFKELQKVDKVNFTFSEKQYENQFIQMFKNKKLDKNFTNTRKQLDYFYHKDKLPYSKRINEIVKKIL